MTKAETAARLTAAYHLVYDVKDSLEPGTNAFQAAYKAHAAIAELMRFTGVAEPDRYDTPANCAKDVAEDVAS